MSDTLRALAAVLPLAAAPVAAADAQALLQAAQAAAQHDLQRPLALRAGTVRSVGAWGFVLAELRSPDGRAFDFTGTRLDEAAREGFASSQVAVLLARRQGRWQVVEQRIGVTDAAWEAWAERHHAPPALFVVPRS